MSTTVNSAVGAITPPLVDESPTTAPRRPRRRYDPSANRAGIGVYAAVVIAAALFLVPFLYIVLVALATPAQVSGGAFSLLQFDPQWQNFVEAVTRINWLHYAKNSLFLSVIVSVLTTFSSALVGFAFARLRGRGKNTLFTIILATMMIPSIATLIPTYILFARLGLVNTYWPWVLWGIAGTPYLIFLFRQFFTAIPLELEDAAIMDGAGWWRIFWRVFLPLSRPMILTSLILTFTWTWGDYLAPALLLNYNNTTLAVATSIGYLDPRGSGIITLQSAGALIYILPVIVIFLFTQRYFMGSGISSGVKG
ncbi:carbohydrate ABC transporter permease [Agromyces sp. M3QZ16-3]|uniref:carbohydrate ABC transporter permease n=1 Tax=Agromyces sp. M3QZ16-3 TaxID=3447585 RepID=UPI003F690812